MKKYLLLLCLIPFLFAGSIQDQHRAVIAKKSGAAPGNPCSGANPSGCLFRETVAGSTLCWTGGNSYCDNTWTVSAGSPEDNDTTMGLGNYNFKFLGVDYEGLQYDYNSTVNDFYFSVILRVGTLPSTADPFITFRNIIDDNYVGRLHIESDGDLCVQARNGATNCSATQPISVDTNYWIKARLQQATGSPVLSGWYSTNGTDWTPIAADSTGSTGDKCEIFKVHTIGSTSRAFYFKDIRFDDEDIENY